MAVDYSVNVLGGFNLGQGISQLKAEMEAEKEKELLEKQREEFKSASMGAARGDADAIERMFAINPQLAMQFEQREAARASEIGAQRAKAEQDAFNEWGLKYASAKTPEEKQRLEQEALNNPLVDFDESDISLAQNQKDMLVNASLFKSMGKDAYSQFFGGGSADLPAETVAFNDLIKDFTPEQQKTAKLIKAGLKGRAMSNAVLSAIESGDVKNLADANAMIKQSEKFAEMTGASRAKAIDQGFAKIENITTNIGNIDRAIDTLNRGAGTGAIERFAPSIKAASRELAQIQNELALDVIGSVTFGALSEGELQLAKDTALDLGMGEAELKDYLQRKKAAQEKLKMYFQEQIDFLDQGGTVAGFLRMKKKESQNSGALTKNLANFEGLSQEDIDLLSF